MSESQQLEDIIKILDDFFTVKSQDSSFVMYRDPYKGYYFLSEETGNKLKQKLIKYKTL